MALTKIGNVKGPKGDKGDKTKISIGNVYEGFEPDVIANTDVNGDVSLDFVLTKGPRGYGVTGATGTKVEGATEVVMHFEDGTDSQVFRLLDGLNGDGVLSLEGKTSGDTVAAAFIYVYNNISEYNKYFTFKQDNGRGNNYIYLGYIAVPLQGPTSTKKIILLDLYSNKKYTLDYSLLNTSTTASDIADSIVTETISTGIVDLGDFTNNGTPPTSEDCSYLNSKTLFESLIYKFKYGSNIYLMTFQSLGNLKSQYLLSLLTGERIARTYNTLSSTWSVTIKKAANDTNCIFTYSMTSTQYNQEIQEMMLYAAQNLPKKKICNFELTSTTGAKYSYLIYVSYYSQPNKYFEINAWRIDKDFHYNGIIEFTEKEIGIAGPLDVVVETKYGSSAIKSSIDPSSKDCEVLNSLTSSGTCFLEYNGYFYVVVVNVSGFSSKTITQNVYKFTNDSSNIFGFFTRSITSEETEWTISSFTNCKTNYVLYRHNIKIALPDNKGQCFFTIIDQQAEEYTKYSNNWENNGSDICQASGWVKDDSGKFHAIYCIDLSSDKIRYIDETATNGINAYDITSSLTVTDKVAPMMPIEYSL